MKKSKKSKANTFCDRAEFSPWIRRAAVVVLLLFVIAPLFTLLAPWQQYVTGSGRVAAYSPIDRPQPVQAPVSGRVVEVYVSEADLVKKGDKLVKIVDIDPDKIRRLETKLQANRKDLEFREMAVETFKSQVGMLKQAQDLAVDAFQAKVEVATERLRAAKQKQKGAQAELDFAKEQEERMARLAPRFVREIKLLEATAKRKKADADLASAKAGVDAAHAALRDAKAQLGKERQVARAKVEEARAKMQAVSSKAAELRSKIADSEGDLRAQNTQLVTAPRAGRVFRLAVNTDSSIVKQSQELLQIVPETARPAVELYVRGVDAPLIEAGRKVRLQFEGWPAIQFMGWPSVAVGTFGGVVALVDPRDSGDGRFRVLIVPDPEDAKWPDGRWLRQGVRAKGWVLLNEVRLWFELWRQLNGFPPVVSSKQPSTFEGGAK